MKRKQRNAAAAALLCAALGVQNGLLPVMAQEQVTEGQEQKEEAVIYASDYGADPTGTFDSAQAVIDTFAAAKAASEAGAKSVRVEFEKGTYQIWKDKCEVRLAHTSNTSSTDGYGMKTIGLLIEEQENLTVEGNDALFMMHGNIMALAVIRSKNIELRNFSWDFAVPTTSEMTVINMGTNEAGQEYTDFYIPKSMPHTITGNTITWTSEKSPYTGEVYWSESGVHWAWCTNANDPEGEFTRRFNTGTDSPFNNAASITHLEGTDDTVVRIVYNGARPEMQKEGMTLELNANGRRETTGALVWESENVTARGLDIHYMHGFGWLLQMSKNMYFYDCTMVPRENGSHLTTGYADGIHASGHSGEVVVENCRFASLHDDPINIHGTFARVETVQDSHTLVLKNIHSQQGGYQQYFKGNKVQFFTRDTLESRDQETAYTVAEVISNPGESGNDLKTMVIRFEEELPDFLSETYAGQPRFVAENISYAPDVTIRNNTFRDLAARAVLCTSRGKVLIENNVFYKMTMDGCNTSNDANLWYESGPVRDLTIRNNVFYVTETGADHNRKVINIDPVTLGGGFPDYTNPIHKNITIEGNTFYLGADTAVGAWSVENLTIRNNKILRLDPNLRIDLSKEETAMAQGSVRQLKAQADGTTRTSANENMYLFKACRNVVIEGNTYDDGQKLYAWYDQMPADEIHIRNDAVKAVPDSSQPASAPVGTVHYTSLDPEILQVDNDGTAKALQQGSARVLAWTEWNGSVIESEPATIQVTATQEQAEAPVIAQSDLICLAAGTDSLQMEAHSSLPVVWSVTDLVSGAPSSKASISEDGLLQVKGDALLKVSASSQAGSDSVVVIAQSGTSQALNPAVSITNENKAGYSLNGTSMEMTLLKGDLYFWNNSIQNMFMVDLPADADPDHLKTIVYVEGMPPREDNQWDTVSFMLAQDVDNYITLGRKSHYDGLTAVREVEQSASEMGGSADDNAFVSGWLGISKEGDSVSLDFSQDGTSWKHVRDLDGAFLNNYKIGFGTWATNERGRKTGFRDLKISSTAQSYEEMLDLPSFRFNQLPNSAPVVSASFDQDACSLGDSLHVNLKAQDADGDVVNTLLYHYVLTKPDGSREESWSESADYQARAEGSLVCTVFAQDAAGQYADAAITQTAAIGKGDGAGRIFSVSVNGRIYEPGAGENDGFEREILLPEALPQIRLEALSDGASVSLQTKEGALSLDEEQTLRAEDCFDEDGNGTLTISTKTQQVVLRLKKAASSKTAMDSIEIPELDLHWTPEDGKIPVLVTDQPEITLKARAKTGNLAVYNKMKGSAVLASAKEGEMLNLPVSLSGGINTLMIDNRAADGIGSKISKVHIVYMPSTDTAASFLLDGTPVETLEDGSLRAVLPQAGTSAKLQGICSSTQRIRLVNGKEVQTGTSFVLENLKPGANRMEVIVSAADGVSEKRTALNVVVPDEKDAALEMIAVNGQPLANLQADSLQTMVQTDRVEISARAQNPAALVQITNAAGSAAAPGSASLDTRLYSDNAEYVITVISPDGTMKETRTVQIEKAEWLSDLNWDADSTTGYGTLRKDAEVDGIPLRIAGEDGQPVLYEKGIGAHANAQVHYTLPADTYAALEGVVGVDYSKYNSGHANVTFTILCDGTEVFNSGIMYGNTPGKSFRAELGNAGKVTLKADQSENSNWDAHSDFAAMKLLMKTAVPAVSDLDPSALEDALRDAEGIKSGYAQADALAAWSEALEQGTQLLEKVRTEPSAVSQSDLDQAAQTIRKALQAVLSSMKAANPMLLQMAVLEAQSLKEQGALEGVNELVVQEFESALQQGVALLEEGSAGQSAFNQAWFRLSRAIQMLNFKTDKSGLAALIAQAEGIDRTDLSEDAAGELEAALEQARAVMEDPAALNDQSIAAAQERLQNAIDAALVHLDYTLLSMLVQAVQNTDLTTYLPEGQEEFVQALSHAGQVLAGAENQQQINDAVSSLHTAWLNLRRAPDEELLKALRQVMDRISGYTLQDSVPEALRREMQAWLDRTGKTMDQMDEGQAKAALQQGLDLLVRAENAAAPADGANTVSSVKPDVSGSSKASVSHSASVSTDASTGVRSWLAAAGAAAAALLAFRKRRK